MLDKPLTAGFKLASPTIREGEKLPDQHVLNGFGCSGANVSPELSWTGAPKDAKSFAVTLYDPDAPTGSGWWHWVVYNIPAGTSKLAAGAGDESGKFLPAGTKQGRTDFGTPGYGGACPPEGHKPHRYIFSLYALDVESLDIPEGASCALIGYMLNHHVIGTARLTATFGR